MSECTCHKNYTLDTLIPKVGVITKITQETPDVKTFCVTAPGGGKLFEHMPGRMECLLHTYLPEPVSDRQDMFSVRSVL